ncbi:MAG TPA: excinuclease ABC subunit UvrA [Verrucomicrobiae bacterium]|nr:excinuclease ABC subunit UvrA [Verrucomicrobiae bacterium]
MQEFIDIRGARQNNLKNVSLTIPKRKITAFTGVSGSGKSSLVFDTIAAESQRLLNDNFSMFVRQLLPRISQPDVDEIKHLNMAVIIDQKPLGGGPQSTVGTVTDIATVLRLLFSRFGEPHVGTANRFSFNDPAGMCKHCNGKGQKMNIDLEASFDKTKSINQGAIRLPEYQEGDWNLELVKQSGLFDLDKKLKDFSQKELDDLYHAKKVKAGTSNGFNVYFEGIVDKFDRLYISRKYATKDGKPMSERTHKMVAPFIVAGPCPVCHGARLNQKALASKIQGYNIAELSALQIDALLEVIKQLDTQANHTLITAITDRLSHVVEIGLGYLTLDRPTYTLSGGESQRLKLVKHLNGALTDVTYIFDEPSVGLHPHEVQRLNQLLQKLRDEGNTILVVEHDPDVIAVADHIVDIGPQAGTRGGQVVFEGTYRELLKAKTITGQQLKQQLSMKQVFRQPTGQLPITNARVNNLQNLTVDIPTGVFTVVTGVSGSGKSSLINQEFLRQHPEAIVVDQTPVSTSNRSNPATYIGILDAIRNAFAIANQVDAGLFSFNSKGACDNCKGAGFLTVDLGFLDNAKTPCDVCDGKRFKDDVLAYKYNGASITEVLAMTMAQASQFFDLPEITKQLQVLNEVGLDYLTLGQPLNTLSGGECQRIKLASELHKQGSVYVLDEPTTGLHVSDAKRLIALIDRLVDTGNTVITIEHNVNIIRQADWIIDLGPEGGDKGGKIMFTGTTKDLLKNKQSLIARYL